MSRTLTIATIQGNNNALEVEHGHYLSVPGAPVQTVYFRTDARTIYASATSGDGNPITDLNITITPRKVGNILVLTWMMNAEVHHDNVFVIHKNGNLITDSGVEGYNNVNGNVRYSGFVPSYYDNDYASTPSNYMIQYITTVENTLTRTYCPAVRGAGATAYTMYLNMPAGSTGADSYEVTVSTGVGMEIGT